MTDGSGGSPSETAPQTHGEGQAGVEAPPIRRLALVVATYFPDSYGGAERQAKILAEALGRRGVYVRLITPTDRRIGAEPEPTAFGTIERIPVRHFPNYGGRRILSTLAWTWRFLRRYRTSDVDAFYVFHARLHAFPALVCASLSAKPLMIKLGGGGDASDFAALRAKRYLYGEWILRALLKRTDGFVANSAEIIDDLRAEGVPEERIFAFPNGVEVAPREAVERAAGTRTGQAFIFAGRLVADKRVEVLVEAAMLARRRGAPMILTLLGEGPERERLAQRVREEGFEDAILLPGRVADVYPQLFANDFFVSASEREGQSNALLEAMSAGCIPIVAGASGAADLIDHGQSGFLAQASTVEDFAAAFEQASALSAEQRQAMSREAYDVTVANTGIDAIANKTIGVLADLRRRRSEVAR